jgi:hypothetical protein
MKKIIFTVLIFFCASHAYACSLTGQVVQGKNRICYYHCPNGKRTITVSESSHCPLDVSGDPSPDPSVAAFDAAAGFCPVEKVHVEPSSSCELTAPTAS